MLGGEFTTFSKRKLLTYSKDHQNPELLYDRERKALNEILLPQAPARNITKGLKNADVLQPEDNDLLAFALGAPARSVLTRAEQIGPQTGWKDGYLSSSHGCKFLKEDLRFPTPVRCGHFACPMKNSRGVFGLESHHQS
jgi:hypothetical protein